MSVAEQSRDRGEVRGRSAGGQRGGYARGRIQTERGGVVRVVQLLYAVRYTLALFQSMEQ